MIEPGDVVIVEFPAFLMTVPVEAVQVVGKLSERDWLAIKRCVAEAIERV